MPFADRDMEDRFLSQHRDDTAEHLRWACLLGAAIMLAFLWQDAALSAAGHRASGIRVVGALPVSALTWYLSRSPGARRHISSISALFWIVYSCLTAAIFVSYEPGRYGLTSSIGLGSFLILLFGVLTFSNLRFWASLLVGLTILLIYAVSVAVWTATDIAEFLTGDFLTAVAVVIGALTKTVFTDRARRRLFETSELLRVSHATVEQQVRDRTAELRIINTQLTVEISDRKRADEDLRLHSEVLAHMAEGVYLIRARDGVIVFANPAFERMFGYEAGELIGKHVSVVNAPSERSAEETARDIIQRLEADGRWDGEVRNIRKDGATFWCSAQVSTFEHPQHGTVRISIHQDISERRRAEEALREERELYADLINTHPSGIYRVRIFNPKTWVKDAWLRSGNAPYFMEIITARFCALLGITKEAFESNPGILNDLVHPDDKEGFAKIHDEAMANPRMFFWEGRLLIDGRIRWVSFESLPRPLDNGDVLWTGSLSDITDRKRAEEERAKLEGQLQQAQKMESVGRLAGGVAHDFNNMLGVILGHTEMALGLVDPAQDAHEDLVEIRNAAQRSADLTRQLLAFARKQTIAPVVLDLNETVAGMRRMLERLVGEHLDVRWQPGADLWPVKVDPSQVDQVLANLCVNARDAIADVGTITIETANSVLDEDYCALHRGSRPGEYVRLAVGDDGSGMDAETQSHLFEPFFTTKEAGAGTGLGLATVYGIVKQNDGFIEVDSEPGRGTTFTIFVPRHAGTTAPMRKQAPASIAALRGHETILLVEDEPALLQLTAQVLEELGYAVLAATTPSEAIRLAEACPGEIHLLLTDVVMPGMNGRKLAQDLLARHPHLQRLFMSGYTADVIAHHGVLDEGVHFIQKPFSISSLATKVREALAGE